MWSKTLAALIAGCLISISLMLNLNYILPLAVDTRLLIGLLAAFPLWVAAMVWCYGSRSAKQAWRRCGGLLMVSIFFNSVFILVK